MKFLFVLSQYLLPQHGLSRLGGLLAECEWPWLKNILISVFISYYRVDMSEAAEEDHRNYRSFNDFFTRSLRPGARPVVNSDHSIVSPADGSISEIGRIEDNCLLQAKGWQYRLETLLADQALADTFRNGDFATVYLAPRDYHRVHMPVAGTLKSMTYVPGDLFSVNNTSASSISNLFARNERLVCVFDTDMGPMALILVGAMIVAGIETVWAGQVAPPPRQLRTVTYGGEQAPIRLEKGEEMGRFKLGSTAIVLFAENRADWQEYLHHGSSLKMGEQIGKRSKITPLQRS